jgi:L-lactate dehydrogenase complex protein LldF
METAQHKNDHAELAATFNRDVPRVDWHDKTLWFVREKRDLASRRIEQWEDLREQASNIKMNVLDNLHTYLLEFEKNALANGASVHWASTPAELNERVLSLIRDSGETKLVKSKSMLTEECHLNEYLKQQGIEVIDTDLGERIVQLAEESPSHIVLPCIHKKKEEIGELFHRHLGTEAGNSDPVYLTSAARSHLRKHFLNSRVAVTGVNFAVAETGEIVVCTNEGNADLGVQLADVHIACMGLEKIIPNRNHLSVFLRLLARSATGQPITTYSSHFRKPRPGQAMHIVLLDNGRSRRLGEEDFRSALKCIRCGACMNTCPVYRRSGGHSYHTTIAGPIGSILAPGLDMKSNADLPFASTLCGSCSNVCPVKIDIHNQLYKWRQVLVQNGHVSPSKKVVMKGLASVLGSYGIYKWAGAGARWVLRHIPVLIENRFNPWSKRRDLPEPPRESFQSWYAKNKKNG